MNKINICIAFILLSFNCIAQIDFWGIDVVKVHPEAKNASFDKNLTANNYFSHVRIDPDGGYIFDNYKFKKKPNQVSNPDKFIGELKTYIDNRLGESIPINNEKRYGEGCGSAKLDFFIWKKDLADGRYLKAIMFSNGTNLGFHFSIDIFDSRQKLIEEIYSTVNSFHLCIEEINREKFKLD